MNVNAILDAGAAVAAAAAESTVNKTGTDFSDYIGFAGKSYGDYLDQIFQEASDTYHVSKDLLKAMAKAESNFKADITSHAGAMGIMQLMPSTAASLGVTDAFDPEQNIMGGAKYISQLLERYNGNLSYAVAAYNAGSGNVNKYGGIPPFKETQNYVARVLQYMEEGVTIPDSTASASTGTPAGQTSASAGQNASLNQLINNSGNTLQDMMSRYFDYDDYLEFLQLFTRIIYEKITGTTVGTDNAAETGRTESASAAQGQQKEAADTGKTETVQEPVKQLTMRVRDAKGNISTYRQKDASESDAYVAYRNMTAGSQNRLAVYLKKTVE